MNQDYQLQEDLDCEYDIYERMRRLIEINPWAWQSAGAVGGLMGGVLSPVLGTLLILVAWFFHSERVVSSLHGLSIGSFVLTIPLLTFGAHCLDLLERKTARLSVEERQTAALASTSPGPRDAKQSDRRRIKLTGASATLAFLFLLSASTDAHQTIFNATSKDVLDKGKMYGGLHVTSKPNNGYSIGNPGRPMAITFSTRPLA